MEKAVKTGRASALGVSGLDDAEKASTCYLEGHCSFPPALVEDGFWNPCSFEGIRPLGPKATAVGAVLIGINALRRCLHEPHVLAIARRHAVSAAAVIIRWNMQAGHPVLIQTTSAKHMADNDVAFKFQLSSLEMGLIGLLSSLYQVTAPVLQYLDTPSMRALGETPSLLGLDGGGKMTSEREREYKSKW